MTICSLPRWLFLSSYTVIVLTSLGAAQTQLWIHQVGTIADDGVGTAVADGAGGVFLGGGTAGSLGGPSAGAVDAWLTRYDSAGNQLWIRQMGTAGTEFLIDSAPDWTGGVFVGGGTAGSLGGPSAGGEDAWFARYDPLGNQLWIRQIGTAGSQEAVIAMASDGSGGMFVGGITNGSLGGPFLGGNYDVWFAHYDGAGNQLWMRHLGTNRYDFLSGAAVDGSGGFYLGGITSGSLVAGVPNASGFHDGWLARYDATGSQLWIRQFGTDADENVDAVATDAAGGVYVGGLTTGSFGAPHAGGIDGWFARYDRMGNQLWLRQVGTGNVDGLAALAPSGSGGVYVGGGTNGSLGGPNSGGYDAWLLHYDGTGNQLATIQFGTASDDGIGVLAPNGAGGAYLGGVTSGSLAGMNFGGEDAWIAHYDEFVATRYCSPAVANSTTQPARLNAIGSNAVASNALALIANQLGLNAFGFFMNSMTPGFSANPGGSQGNLCLGGSIGRYIGAGQVLNSGASGSFMLRLDLSVTPTPVGAVSILAGQTWNFQGWYRDANPGPTSNFTDALTISFD